MKTIYKLTIAALMAASFTACGNGDTTNTPAATPTPVATPTPTVDNNTTDGNTTDGNTTIPVSTGILPSFN